MSIKKAIRESRFGQPLYRIIKRKREKINVEKLFRYHGKFTDRSAGNENLCIILAGYKKVLYNQVFYRIRKFQMTNMDICVITSGLFCDDIAEICKQNNWSYLSTEENNVNLVQNVAIKLHPNAKFIYKLDEDIFITENYFIKMKEAFFHAQKGHYDIGVIAPIIPLNAYGYGRVLEKTGNEAIFTERFGFPKYTTGSKSEVENNPEIAKFLWGAGGYIPHIDVMNRQFSTEEIVELPCPIRFSIGAIMYERSLWEEMGYFKNVAVEKFMGTDEEALCSFCTLASRPIMVSENIVVGHFSFGPQTEEMKLFFIENKELFKIN